MNTKHSTSGKQKGFARKRANRTRFVRRSALASLSALVLPVAASAQTASVPSLAESFLRPQSSSLLDIFSSPTASTVANGPGVTCSELLRGNGTGVGYALSHGGVLADTLRISITGRMLTPNVDYWLSAANGSLNFAQPVRRSDTVSAYYRYIAGQDANRSNLPFAGFQLGLGSSTRMGLFYGMPAVAANGLNITTQGMALDSTFGANKSSHLSGLLFFSHSQLNTNLALNDSATVGTTNVPTPAKAPKGGENLIVQDFATQAGGLQVRANYQDIGQNFGGFQSLRSNYADNKPLLDQLAQLEGEKGVKRLGFGLDYTFADKPKAITPTALTGTPAKPAVPAPAGAPAAGAPATPVPAAPGTPPAAGAPAPVTPAAPAVPPVVKTPTGLHLNWNQIEDGKDSILQQSLGFNSSAFHFNYDAQNIGTNFASFNGLRETQKGDWARAKGMRSSSMGFGLNFKADKAGDTPNHHQGLDFSSQEFGDTTGSLSRRGLNLNSGNLQFSYFNRLSASTFTRLNDLSDADKNQLALDTRRMFEPNAQLKDITPAERAQVGREAGLDRSGWRSQLALNKTSNLTVQQFNITNQVTAAAAANTLAQTTNAGGLQRNLLDYQNKWLHFFSANQSVAGNFLRLGDLTDKERAVFGNEFGLRSSQIGLDAQLNKTTKLNFSSLQVAPTGDALATALTAAKASSDPNALLPLKNNDYLHRAFNFETKGLKLGMNQADTGKYFTRAADLAVPDAEKAVINSEIGFSKTDYTLHYDGLKLLKGLTLDDYNYSGANSIDKLGHDLFRRNLLYTPSKLLKFTYSADSDISQQGGVRNGISHSNFTLDKDFGKGMAFSLYNQSQDTYAASLTPQTMQTTGLNFHSDPAKPNAFALADKRVQYQDGTFEDTRDVTLKTMPTKQLTINVGRHDYSHETQDYKAKPDTAPTTPNVMESTDSLDVQWQATKKFALTAGASQHDSTDKTNVSDTVSVGLKGDPLKNVTVAAQFNEVHNNTKNTRDVADFAISNAVPFKFGPIQNLKITCRYASLNDQRLLQNETMAGNVAWTICKNTFLLDYAGLTNVNGQTGTARTYSFATDPNPKKWFHAGFYYKHRTFADGTTHLIRRFTTDMRLNKNTSFTYLFGTLPEDDKGNISPLNNTDFELKHALRSNLACALFYRINDNLGTKILTRSLGFSLEGQLSHTSKLQLSYSKGANGFADHYDRTEDVNFLFDQQLNANNSITLSANLRGHDALNAGENMRANIDFHTHF